MPIVHYLSYSSSYRVQLNVFLINSCLFEFESAKPRIFFFVELFSKKKKKKPNVNVFSSCNREVRDLYNSKCTYSEL